MKRWQDLPDPFRRQRQEELRRAREHVQALLQAIEHADAKRFYHLTHPYDGWPDFWPLAVRAIPRTFAAVPPEIQIAFQDNWVETKMLSLNISNQPALCRTLRLLMPAYRGPALRLYRGASAVEHRRRAYGVSWSSELSAARLFAEQYRVRHEGSVVLETLAPPEAIISVLEYPPPITEEEKATLPPGTIIEDLREEAEVLVDCRRLKQVKVLQRCAPERD